MAAKRSGHASDDTAPRAKTAPGRLAIDPAGLRSRIMLTTKVRNVLVVDDEPYIGRIIQLKLESGPYRVELVQDGKTALERLRSDSAIDLILLDIMMPHVSGLDVLAELRQIPHRADTPVIVLTAKGHETDREQATTLGATDFLTKPFSPKKLLARIDELFSS